MNYRSITLAALVIIGVFLLVISQKGEKLPTRRAIVDLEAPAFTLLSMDGKAAGLSQFAGKRVFIHFWATWCKECKEELPGIQALYNRKKTDPDFVFLSAIYREDPAVTMKYMKDNNYDFPLYTDPGERMAREYGVSAVPETFIIGKDGILKQRIIGPGRWENIE